MLINNGTLLTIQYCDHIRQTRASSFIVTNKYVRSIRLDYKEAYVGKRFLCLITFGLIWTGLFRNVKRVWGEGEGEGDVPPLNSAISS